MCPTYFIFLQKKFRQNISTKKIKNGQKNIFCFEISNIFDLFSRNFLTKFFSVKKQNNNWTFSNNLFFGFLNIFLPFRNDKKLFKKPKNKLLLNIQLLFCFFTEKHFVKKFRLNKSKMKHQFLFV